MYIIQNFKKWSALNEGLFWDVVEREPIGGTMHKVKVKYLDANSFKVKAVNDADLSAADGSMDPRLMDAIVNFLKTHDGTDFARQYPSLADLAAFYKDNFFTFNVKKENDRRQVVVFTIQKRANFKGVTPEIKVVSDDKAAALAQAPEAKTLLAQSDKAIAQNTAEKPAEKPAEKAAAGSLKLEKPIVIADLANQTADSPIFKMFDSVVASLATSKLFTDKRATDLIDKVADELEAQKIGENSIKLVKALMAGFGTTTYVDKYGRTKPQTQITQETVDKLMAFVPKTTAQNSSRQYGLGVRTKYIFEQGTPAPAAPAATTPAQTASAPAKLTLPADFKMEEFIKSIAGEAPKTETTFDTGDIKIPDGGIKYGVKGDADVKKVQQLMLDKLGVVLGDDPDYKALKKATATGNYLSITKKMVEKTKAGFELKDTDGSTITAELVHKLRTDGITESYLGLDGRIYEKFNVEAAKKVSSGGVATSTVPAKQSTEDAKKSEDAKKTADSKTEAASGAKPKTDADLKADVDTLVDDLDDLVTTDNLTSILNILKKYRDAKAVDESDIDKPVTVSAIKRIIDLYAADENGDSLLKDVESVGTKTLGSDAVTMKTQIINLLKKY